MAFKVNAAAFDERVERALIERAIGYEMDSEKIMIDGKIVHVPVRKHFPPDVGAIKPYLFNRMPHKYKDVVEQPHTVVELRSPEQIERVQLDVALSNWIGC